MLRSKLIIKCSSILLAAIGLAACATSPPAPEPPAATLPGSAREATPVTPPAAIPPSASGNPPFYDVMGERYHVLEDSRGYTEQGIASWYGREFHGRRTSNGEVYDMYALTAAHKTLPLPTTARVTNLATGKSIVVRINDRGPFKKGRLIDLSYGAARELGFVTAGTAPVEVQVVSGPTAATSNGTGNDVRHMYVQLAAFGQPGNAEALKRRLESQGFSKVGIRYDARSPGAPYRVRIGPVSTAAEFDAVTARTAGLGLGEPQLIVETADRDGNSFGQALPGS